MADEILLFVNIGWMVDYKGNFKADPTLGGFGHLKTNKFGHEAWNFSPRGQKLYGYVPRSANINLRNLVKNSSKESLSGITVVWIARNPRNRVTYIVGWYRNATVYKENDHVTLKRAGGVEVGYQIVAPAPEATLLKPDQRLFAIPTKKEKGNLGQSPIWYGGSESFRSQVRNYLSTGLTVKPVLKVRVPRQNDPEARKKIEIAAVSHATQFYESAEGGNRLVTSVEKDGVGWDLNVVASNVNY